MVPCCMNRKQICQSAVTAHQQASQDMAEEFRVPVIRFLYNIWGKQVSKLGCLDVLRTDLHGKI